MPSSTPGCRGTLDDFLAADDLVAVPEFSDRDWDQVRRASGWQVARRFCTLRNLVVHRGRFAFDAMGFAWGGIYRTLLVTSIVTTSYRNEGHFRSDDRIFGTADFFSGGFALPKSAAEFREIVRLVNLRHHVAGVATPDDAGHVRVRPGYEADYAYVATAFIESIRRGLDVCGLPPDSRAGRRLASQVCTVLYQLAGFTGLGRMPRDLAAHDRFRAATAAEVQRRLALGTAVTGTLLDDAADRTGDRRLASISQLFRYLTGDSHVPLDQVIDLADDATPAECVEALRGQVDAAISEGGLPPDLERHLGQIMATIG